MFFWVFIGHSFWLKFLPFFRLDLRERLLSGERSDLRLQSLDSGEEFENHEEDQNESDHDDGVDVSLYADQFGEIITECREESDRRHAAPDDESHGKFEEGLPAFPAEVVRAALPNHKRGETQNDDLIEMELHRDTINS